MDPDLSAAIGHDANDGNPFNNDQDDTQSEPGGAGEKKRRGLRGLLSKASLQDQLLDKLLQQMIPIDATHADAPSSLQGKQGITATAPPNSRPNFNLATMSTNFRRFNSRIGVVFAFQARAIRLLSWHRPPQTLSFLACYTLTVLNPFLLPILPAAILLLFVLIPSFIARHPAADATTPSETIASNGISPPYGYSARGPPLAPARTVKPAKELSRDFFKNMKDLQNSMADFSAAHDQVVASLLPLTNFGDEARSSAVFVALCAFCLLMSIAAHLLPWKLMMLIIGWGAVGSGHPAVAALLAKAKKDAEEGKQGEKAKGAWEAWVRRDIILDEAPETREVEIFELQRECGGEWESWVFCPTPYDPLSAARLVGDRPAGTRFFEDVLPPAGWEWSEKKWALDLWSREWVEERIITGVEVETEGERWVYDMWRANEAAGGPGVIDHPSEDPRMVAAAAGVPAVSWEEGEGGDGAGDGVGKRGEWRRRRWVRLVKRKKITEVP